MSVKGQTFSMDFLIACSVFILAIGIVYVYWVHAIQEINQSERINDMIEKAYSISKIWFREGVPKYWNESNVIDLGLSNDHRINQTKMNNLEALGYENVSKLIGIGIYDYNFTVCNITGEVIKSFGKNPPSNPENLIKVKRIGLLDNGTIVTIEVLVWD